MCDIGICERSNTIINILYGLFILIALGNMPKKMIDQIEF